MCYRSHSFVSLIFQEIFDKFDVQYSIRVYNIIYNILSSFGTIQYMLINAHQTSFQDKQCYTFGLCGHHVEVRKQSRISCRPNLFREVHLDLVIRRTNLGGSCKDDPRLNEGLVQTLVTLPIKRMVNHCIRMNPSFPLFSNTQIMNLIGGLTRSFQIRQKSPNTIKHHIRPFSSSKDPRDNLTFLLYTR